MSYNTKREAEIDARRFKPMLPKGGKGWKTRISESIGWHLSFTHGPINVFYHNPCRSAQRWVCLISDDPEHAGYGYVWSGGRTRGKRYTLPQEAIQAEVRKVRSHIRRMKEVYSAVLVAIDEALLPPAVAGLKHSREKV